MKRSQKEVQIDVSSNAIHKYPDRLALFTGMFFM